jgi:hypothetical protein
MSLQEDILAALENLVTLTITTSVVAGAGADEKASMVTEINLLLGDISTDIPKEFVDGGPYASLRAFHQAREQQGADIVKSNVEALKSLLGLAQEAANQPGTT